MHVYIHYTYTTHTLHIHYTYFTHSIHLEGARSDSFDISEFNDLEGIDEEDEELGGGDEGLMEDGTGAGGSRAGEYTVYSVV